MEAKKNQENALVVKMVDHYLPSVLRDTNFDSLDQAIEDMAKNDLPEDAVTRDRAVSVIKEWESNVISRLVMHDSNIGDLIRFFSSQNVDCDDTFMNEMGDEGLEDLVNASGTRKEYQAFAVARDVYEDFKQSSEPQMDEYFHNGLPSDELAVAKQQYALDHAKWSMERNRKRNARNLAFIAWHRKMMKAPEVKEMVGKANAYRKRIKTLKSDCQDKSGMAKLNISIGNNEVRSSLRELLGFSRKM